MVSGYNHNVKYQDLVFHVQTEDSGVQHPRVITHIFIGGTIVASVKTPYDAEVSRPDLKTYLTELMQTQHKSMLKGLIHGTYDAAIAQMRGFAAKLDGPQPLNVAAGQARSSFGRQSTPEPPKKDEPPPHVPVAPRVAVTDAARPDFSHQPPPRARTPQSAPQQQAQPPQLPPRRPLPKAPIPIEEQGYAEAQLIEADDQSVDSLFGNLISEKTLDEVILSFLGTDKPPK
jgi:hypothetical protein